MLKAFGRRHILVYGFLLCALLFGALCLFLKIGAEDDLPDGNRSNFGRIHEKTELPLVWYGEDGLYTYEPRSQTKRRIAKFSAEEFARLKAQNQNPAESCHFKENGEKVFFLKDFALCSLDLTFGLRRKPVKIADDIREFHLVFDETLLCMSADRALYLLLNETEKIPVLSDVKAYWLDENREKMFVTTTRGAAYRYDFTDRSCKRLSGGVRSVRYVSPDLSVIYYRAKKNDLFLIDGLQTVKCVDVGVKESFVISGTGHAYYLKADAEHDSDFDKTGTLFFFDGTKKQEVLRDVGYVEDRFSKEMQSDRLIACRGISGNHAVFLTWDELSLNTEFYLTDAGIADVYPSGSEDVLYFVRKRGGEGTVFSKPYQRSGFGAETGRGIRADFILSASRKRILTGTFTDHEQDIDVSVNGKAVASRISGYYMDETGTRKEMYFYRTKREEESRATGELLFWSGNEGEEALVLADDVKEYHVFSDFSASVLSFAKGDEENLTLFYRTKDGEFLRIADRVLGTARGTGE